MTHRPQVARNGSLAFGLSVALGAGLGSTNACSAGICDLFEVCSTRAGLRYVSCDDGRHLFNDGADFGNANKAFEYCHCPFRGLTCADGRTVTLCKPGEFDSSAVFSDGSTTGFAEGYAACFGFSTCVATGYNYDDEFEFDQNECTFGRWFLSCSMGSTTEIIAFDGSLFSDPASALAYCRGPIL